MEDVFYEKICSLKEDEKPVFNIDERGFNAKAFFLKNSEELGVVGDALIVITYNKKVIRRILYPAYKIWNIAAHFSDIVDGELSKTDKERGYRIAGSDGLYGCVMPKEV